MANVNVIFHSVSGHTFRLAEAIGEGIAEVPRCQSKLLLIGEPNGAKPITMPELEKRHHDYRICARQLSRIWSIATDWPLALPSIGAA